MPRAVSPRGPARTRAPHGSRAVVPVALLVLGGCAAPASLAPTTPPPASHEPVVLTPEPARTRAPEVRDVTVPDVVGMNLRDAANTVAAVGVAGTTFTDATGEREVDAPQEWRVCAQSPLGGDIAPATVSVGLVAVRQTEACP